jgi:hypothetical protein
MTELVREAHYEGQAIARLRCYDGDGATIVEYASSSTGRQGSYRFASAPEAFRFMQEALTALQYLGCRVV